MRDRPCPTRADNNRSSQLNAAADARNTRRPLHIPTTPSSPSRVEHLPELILIYLLRDEPAALAILQSNFTYCVVCR
jgi:hypothetical protein